MIMNPISYSAYFLAAERNRRDLDLKIKTALCTLEPRSATARTPTTCEPSNRVLLKSDGQEYIVLANG